MATFNRNTFYSRSEINRVLGGGQVQAYMITRGGPVLAACIDPKVNPRAPEEIYPGFGKMIQANAELALAQPEPFYMFLKRGNKAYEYMGLYDAYALSTSPSEIAAAEALSGRTEVRPISGVLKLRAVSGMMRE